MKVFIINYRSFLRLLPLFLLVALLICIIGTTGLDALGVNNAIKDLPIYSVESENKVAAITFDCAWGAGTEGYHGKTARIAEQQATGSLDIHVKQENF